MAFTAMVLGGTALAAGGLTYAATSASQKKPDQMPIGATPIGTQVVDPMSKSGNMGNLGRAALIATSPQGVQGTDTSARYKLLGNVTGLGN